MKAMILAAGMGRRLAPLTQETPKALVKVGEKTMLEIVLHRLAKVGVDGFAVNVFHLADDIEDFLRKRANFGLNIAISREETLLDTGGGLKKAASIINDGRPFFIHNVDVLSEIDLTNFYRTHRQNGALATLAVQNRKTARPLLFDSSGRLLGRAKSNESTPDRKIPVSGAQSLAFCGISVASAPLLSQLSETGAFSLTDAYARLASQGEDIRAFPCDGVYWQDVGTPEKLEQARKHMRLSLNEPRETDPR